jgi:hypothetical protein
METVVIVGGVLQQSGVGLSCPRVMATRDEIRVFFRVANWMPSAAFKRLETGENGSRALAYCAAHSLH